MEIFSPILAVFSVMTSATVESVSRYFSASRASTSAGLPLTICLAMSVTISLNSGVLATKSVSQLTSTMAPVPHLEQMWLPTMPSAAMRLHSVSAFLQSIMPQPVRPRRSITSLAVKFAILNSS